MQRQAIKDKKSKHSESIQNFFDTHASDYKAKYEKRDAFYEYFFFERLDKATDGINFKGKKVLDIGAGTGPLYDYLQEKGMSSFESYHATDLSSEMLSKSNIPENNLFVGDFIDLNIEEEYDLIFMLGVSTYLDPSSMEAHTSKIGKILASEGIFIVTFTNRNSLDIQVRNFLTPLMRLFVRKNRIISQTFETWFYSRKSVESMLKAKLTTLSTQGLNHTFFPVSRIFPKTCIWIAKKISKIKENKLKFCLSSDLLFKAKKNVS